MFKTLYTNEDGIGKPLMIVLAIVGIIAIAGIGYAIGTNNAESDTQKMIDEKTAQLQTELKEAKESVSDEVGEAQEDIGEGQQTIESLQAENTQLKATIEQQNKKIAELESQLEQSNGGTSQ